MRVVSYVHHPVGCPYNCPSHSQHPARNVCHPQHVRQETWMHAALSLSAVSFLTSGAAQSTVWMQKRTTSSPAWPCPAPSHVLIVGGSQQPTHNSGHRDAQHESCIVGPGLMDSAKMLCLAFLIENLGPDQISCPLSPDSALGAPYCWMVYVTSGFITDSRTTCASSILCLPQHSCPSKSITLLRG